MSSYNASLIESLQSLYEYLGNLRLSLEMVRKLAKHLNFDTYVDSDIKPLPSPLASLSPAQNQDQSDRSDRLDRPAKRLSIAGTNLLIDIDFSPSDTVTNVALSVGTLTPQMNRVSPFSSSAELDASQFIKGQTLVDEITTVALDFSDDATPSFLGRGNCVEAENILRLSLSGTYLGLFPHNLRYLSQLDQEPFSNGNLVTNLDRIARFLCAVHYQECQYSGSDTDISEGWTSSFGKVLLNDFALNKMGIFLQFWKSLRPMLLAGIPCKTRKALLTLHSQSLLNPYLENEKDNVWTLYNHLGQPKLFKFDFSLLASPLPSTTAQGLVLSFDDPIYITKQILEYLDLLYLIPMHSSSTETMQALIESGTVYFKNEEDMNPDISFVFDDAASLVPVHSINLHLLKQLNEIVPVLRNFLLFQELIESVDNSSVYQMSQDLVVIMLNKNNRLRNSLKLPGDVPNEELLALKTFSADYLNAPILQSTASLLDFSKQGSPRDGIDMQEVESSGSMSEDSVALASKKGLTISLQDIWYESRTMDLVISIQGNINQDCSISQTFKMKNGILLLVEKKTNNDTDAMDVDGEAESGSVKAVGRFCKALTISNDVALSLEVIQKV